MDGALERLAAAVDEVLGEDLVGASDRVLLDRQRELERLRRKLDAATVANVGAVHRQGACGYDGAGTTNSWLHTRLRLTRSGASGLIEASRFLPDSPGFAEAFTAGRICLGHVLVGAQLAKEVEAEQVPVAVGALLVQAERVDAAQLKHVAKRIRAYLRPEGGDEPSPEDRHQRSLYVSETFQGAGVLKGDLTPEHLAMASTFLTAAAVKADPEDDRAPAERRHDALSELFRHGLSTMGLPSVGGEQPHLGVLVHAEDLRTIPSSRGRRRATVLRFDGEDALATTYAYLDDDPPPLAPEWVTAGPGDEAGTDLSGLDWATDGAGLDWATDGSGLGWDADGSGLDWDADGSGLDSGASESALDCSADGSDLDWDADESDLDWDADGSGLDWDSALLGWAAPHASAPPLAPAGPGVDPGLAAAAATVSGRASRMPGPGMGGVTEHGGILPPQTVRRIACDAGINRVVLGPTDVPINAGRRLRVVSAAQRRVVVARDGGCRFHGCDRPPAWTQVHHVVHWADGGPTDLPNLLSLCHHHHHRVHDEGWRLNFDGTTVTIHRPDGTILDPP